MQESENINDKFKNFIRGERYKLEREGDLQLSHADKVGSHSSKYDERLITTVTNNTAIPKISELPIKQMFLP